MDAVKENPVTKCVKGKLIEMALKEAMRES